MENTSSRQDPGERESGPATQSQSSGRPASRLRFWLNIAMVLVVFVGLSQSIRVALRDLRNSDHKIQLQIEKLATAAELATTEEDQRRLAEEIDQLRSQKTSLKNLDWLKISLAIPCSILGILSPGVYWFWTLQALDIRVPGSIAARAYYVGNLGKYVPGKAMVLVLRSTALKPYGATIPMTMISVFVETLTTIAIGAAVGVVALTWIDVPNWIHALAWISAIVAVAPTLPPVFVPLLQSRLARENPLRDRLRRDYNWGLMGRGWMLSVIGWLILGTGLYFVVLALPQHMPPSADQSANNYLTISHSSFAPVDDDATDFDAANKVVTQHRQPTMYVWIVCVAACSLSVVAGFVSLLPGGAGVRELVLTILLSPIVGFAAALVAAIIHRLATIIGELLLAGLSILAARKYDRIATKPTL